MFGGMRGGRSSLRVLRIGLLVVFLVFAATLHDKGSTYNVLHVVYLVLVIGLLAASVAMSRGSGGPGRNGRNGRGPFGNQGGSVGGGSFGTPPPNTRPVEQPDPEAGP
jgi:hypothetical protein